MARGRSPKYRETPWPIGGGRPSTVGQGLPPMDTKNSILMDLRRATREMEATLEAIDDHDYYDTKAIQGVVNRLCGIMIDIAMKQGRHQMTPVVEIIRGEHPQAKRAPEEPGIESGLPAGFWAMRLEPMGYLLRKTREGHISETALNVFRSMEDACKAAAAWADGAFKILEEEDTNEIPS
jgi:hypothetical protein